MTQSPSPTRSAALPDAAAFEARVMEVVETIIRPRLKRDGGDITIDRIEGTRILVTLTGACMGCPLSGMTLSGVQQKIMEAVGRPVRVVPSATVPRTPAPRPATGPTAPGRTRVPLTAATAAATSSVSSPAAEMSA